MRRSYFFLLDKLKITSAERKLMMTLIIALTLLGLLSISLPDQKITDTAEYAKLQQAFEERSQQLYQDSVDKMARYLPAEKSSDPELRKKPEQNDEDNLKREPNERSSTYASLADTNTGTNTDIENSGSEEPKKSSADKKIPPKIDVNTANRETLQILPGIGPAYSERIITYRQENGPFSSPEDLKKVKGIGPKTLEDILPLLDRTTFRDN